MNMPQDPVCNTKVKFSSEWKYLYKGRRYFFCSEKCLKNFKEKPEEYIDKTADGC